jgi:hypothetical protein
VNKSQKVVLAIYSVIILAMVIYPPFDLIIQGNLIRSEYSYLWEPIQYGSAYGKTPLGVINIPKILIQMLGATLITGALTLMCRSKKI